MIDYCELPEDGIKFEQLVREMFVRSGFEVHWTGVGPDGGRDLIVIEEIAGPLAIFKRRWLISCKHYAKSGKSVGIDDLRDIVDSCRAIGAGGFLLACSTQPSASAVRRFDELSTTTNIIYKYWDSIEITKRLYTPGCFPLINIFFPESSKHIGWNVYNTLSPSFWAANYKDYFLYLSSRSTNSFPNLHDIESILEKLESIPMPKSERSWNGHYVRPRGVYFDNKNEHYTVFADYLFPKDERDMAASRRKMNEVLKDGQGLYSENGFMWALTYWDINYVACNQISEHFHLDHKQYYEAYMDNFKNGLSRDGFLSENLYLDDVIFVDL